MSVAHLIIVDGYNLVLRAPTLRPGPEQTLAQGRAKLVNLLSWAVGAGEARFLVVFDGAEDGGAPSGSGRVAVRYSRPPASADDLIRSIVEDEVGRVERLTVVTSDLEIARHARAVGAEVALADLFLASVLGPAGAGPSGEGAGGEKPKGLSRRELEEWAKLFAARRGEPEDPEASE